MIVQVPVNVVAAILVTRTGTVSDNVFAHQVLLDQAVEMTVDRSFANSCPLFLEGFRDLFRSQMLVLIFDQHLQDHLALFGTVTVCLTDSNRLQI